MIQRHLPKPVGFGRPRIDNRMILNSIIYVLTTGCRLQDMPKLFGYDSTANLRLRKRQRNKIWKNILSDAIKFAYHLDKIQLQKILIASSTIPTKKGKLHSSCSKSKFFTSIHYN
jgi:transposase